MTTGLRKFDFLIYPPAEEGINAASVVNDPKDYICPTQAESFVKPLCFQWHILTDWEPHHRSRERNSSLFFVWFSGLSYLSQLFAWLSAGLAYIWDNYRYWIMAGLILYFLLWPFLLWLWEKYWTREIIRAIHIPPSQQSFFSNDVSAKSSVMMVEEATELGNKSFENPVEGAPSVAPTRSKQSDLAAEPSLDKGPMKVISSTHHPSAKPAVPAHMMATMYLHGLPISMSALSSSGSDPDRVAGSAEETADPGPAIDIRQVSPYQEIAKSTTKSFGRAIIRPSSESIQNEPEPDATLPAKVWRWLNSDVTHQDPGALEAPLILPATQSLTTESSREPLVVVRAARTEVRNADTGKSVWNQQDSDLVTRYKLTGRPAIIRAAMDDVDNDDSGKKAPKPKVRWRVGDTVTNHGSLLNSRLVNETVHSTLDSLSKNMMDET